jgi:hypothetical protein
MIEYSLFYPPKKEKEKEKNERGRVTLWGVFCPHKKKKKKKERKKMGGFDFKGFSSFFFNFSIKFFWRIFCFQKIIKFRWLNLHWEKQNSQFFCPKNKSLMGSIFLLLFFFLVFSLVWFGKKCQPREVTGVEWDWCFFFRNFCL